MKDVKQYDKTLEAQSCEGPNHGLHKSAKLLLRRVFRILRGCGISEIELREIALESLLELEKIRDSQPCRLTARQALMFCDLVLRWRRDCRFLDSNGLPLRLALCGTDVSFEALVGICAPEIGPQVMLKSLEDLGVVRILEDGLIELISESVVACSGKDGTAIASEAVLEHISGFLGSVEFNVFDKPSRARGRFERACYASVPKDLVPVLEQLVSARGQAFVDAIDEWLSRRAVYGTVGSACSGSEQETILVGAGAYVFVRENFT